MIIKEWKDAFREIAYPKAVTESLADQVRKLFTLNSRVKPITEDSFVTTPATKEAINELGQSRTY
jgi:hypothetical protein